MTNKELIWRYLLVESRQRQQWRWQQKEVAAMLGFAPGTVHRALFVPRRAGAVAVESRGFRIRDWKKFLLIWAVFRNMSQDRIWQARLKLPPDRVEGQMIPEARFSGASGFKFRYNYIAADYDEVLIYLDEGYLDKLKYRFSSHWARFGETTITVLKPDRLLGDIVPPEQIYVDLWQMSQWWASEFIKALEQEFGID
ncbi:MAG: hypothetical protein QXP27_08980 [Candidatus Methanomethyliaceae archaeon]